MKDLPNRAQIGAIADVDALRGLQEAVTDDIIRIETDLEHRPGDDDWALRAAGALGHHRKVRHWLVARIKELERQGPRLRRERDECDALALELTEGRFSIDTRGLKTAEAAEAMLADLRVRLDALEGDREDELHEVAPDDRDQAFISLANRKLKFYRAQIPVIERVRGELERRERRAHGLAIEQTRDRTFIRLARETLDKAVWDHLWYLVDQECGRPSEHKGDKAA